MSLDGQIPFIEEVSDASKGSNTDEFESKQAPFHFEPNALRRDYSENTGDLLEISLRSTASYWLVVG